MSRHCVAARLKLAVAHVIVLLNLVSVVRQEMGADQIDLVNVVAVLGIAVDARLANGFVAIGGPVAAQDGEHLLIGHGRLDLLPVIANAKHSAFNHRDRIGQVGGADTLYA